MKKKKYFYNILLIIILSLISFEIYYRFKLPSYIRVHFSNYFLLQNQTLNNIQTEVDKIFTRTVEQSECLFRANTNIDLTFLPISNNLEQKDFSVKTNNLGLLSENNYSFEKKENEYRIVFLGESFTGPTTSTYQWVDTVEELFSKNNNITKRFNVKTYNLGWVGGGFETFIKEFEICGKLLKPDLIIVNYLELDFPRGPSGNHLHEIDKQISFASDSLKKLPNDIPVILTVMPDYSEVMNPSKPLAKTNLLKEKTSFEIFDMRKYLPMHLNKKKRETWFNLPHDAHYSDRGGEIYARAISGLISQVVFSDKMNYDDIQTKYSDLVLDYEKKNIRLIDHSFSGLINQYDFKKKFLESTLNKIIKSRVLHKTPYFYNLILKKYHPLKIPYNELDFRGFEKYYFDEDKPPLLINVFCTSPPVDLSNSNCYSHLQTFVNFN